MKGGEVVTMSVDDRIKLFLKEGRKRRCCVEGDLVQRVWLASGIQSENATFNISHASSFLFCVICGALFRDKVYISFVYSANIYFNPTTCHVHITHISTVLSYLICFNVNFQNNVKLII